MKLVSFIFSFRNEEGNLKNLVERVDKSLQKTNGWKYEMIFINDDSSDQSEKILIELQKKFPIKIINMSRQFGTNPCVLAGFENCSGDCIIYMDSDLQDPPELIPELITEYEKGVDVVHTMRTKRLGESRIRLFLTKIAYKVIRILSDINLQPEVGDFKLISRRALNKILRQNEFNPYIRGLSVWVGYKQTYVNYERDPRQDGKSKFSLMSAPQINQFVRGVTSYSSKPLYLGIFLGFFTLFFSLILIIYALYAKFVGIAVPGTTGIIVTISFFSGVILFTLGFIGIYLAKLFEQSRGRPEYIIKEIIEKK